jgi:hypothetical protein
MDRQELLRRVAPCGLLCYTCTAAKDGAIQNHSRTLLTLLDSFDDFAERFSDHEPRLRRYPSFKDVLLLLSEAECEGCREGVCAFPGCPVPGCITQREHDFCYECSAFPCGVVSADFPLREKWLAANRRMAEIGTQAYFDEMKDTSHYA